jgi:hypothetical protein
MFSSKKKNIHVGLVFFSLVEYVQLSFSGQIVLHNNEETLIHLSHGIVKGQHHFCIPSYAFESCNN